jgi:hypothetical protein
VNTKEERAKKEGESTKKTYSKGKGTKRAHSQASGKDAGKKIKRGREVEVKRKGVEEELESAHDLEMTDVMDLPTEQPMEEMEPLKGEKEVGLEKPRAEKKNLKGETEAERLKREKTEQEGRKMVQESVEKVLKTTVSEHAKGEPLNVQEGQEPEREPASQELTDMLKGVRVQCGEVKDLLHQAVQSCGKIPPPPQGPVEPKKPSPNPSSELPARLAEDSLKPSGGQPLSPLKAGISEALPPAPVEMVDVQVQAGKTAFQGRETWEVTFLSTGSVRVEIQAMNSRGELEEPTTIEMSVEKFFRTKSTWSPNIRSFKFHNEALPPILSTAMDRIF